LAVHDQVQLGPRANPTRCKEPSGPAPSPNREGARVGKGGGFSDLEVAFLVEAGVLRPDTVLATTVHPLQVVDEPLPETIHDFRVDLIVGPDEAIWCPEPHRPPGILREQLDQEKIAEVPVLAALAAGR
jgi:5-formyltetrahydrofolate cyclo-ligase